MTQLCDKRNVFPISFDCMPHLDSNIPSNIYYACESFEVLRFARTTSDINTFVTLSDRLLKRMQKWWSEHRSITSMLNKIFLQTQQRASSNFFHYLELELYIYTYVCLFYNLFMLFVFLLVYLFACLFVCLCRYYVIFALSCIFISM